MAVVIPFEDFVQARRRAQDRVCAARCVEIIEAALQLTLEMFATAPPLDRPLYARRVRQLSELLEYAVQVQ